MAKRIGVFFLGAVLCALCIEFSDRFPSLRHGFVATVEAVVGRPLTPVSVSGVARRTARRCDGDC
jgi:hypothetical protein